MKKYRDLSGDSGVVAYEIGHDSIAVRFQEGPVYVYTHASAGRPVVETMKKLAASGHGLSTYISQSVKENYAAKLPRPPRLR